MMGRQQANAIWQIPFHNFANMWLIRSASYIQHLSKLPFPSSVFQLLWRTAGHLNLNSRNQDLNEEEIRHWGTFLGEMREGSWRSESAGRCPLITFSNYCWGIGGRGFLQKKSDCCVFKSLYLMGSRMALWWHPITNTRARSAEDPHCAGINYSLPCLHKFRDCYQLWGTFLLSESAVRPDSECMLILLRWNQALYSQSSIYFTLSIDEKVVYTSTWFPDPLTHINKLLMK